MEEGWCLRLQETKRQQRVESQVTFSPWRGNIILPLSSRGPWWTELTSMMRIVMVFQCASGAKKNPIHLSQHCYCLEQHCSSFFFFFFSILCLPFDSSRSTFNTESCSRCPQIKLLWFESDVFFFKHDKLIRLPFLFLWDIQSRVYENLFVSLNL